jgi:hypothetical protein
MSVFFEAALITFNVKAQQERQRRLIKRPCLFYGDHFPLHHDTMIVIGFGAAYGFGLTLLEALDAFPVPTPLVAVTVNE